MKNKNYRHFFGKFLRAQFGLVMFILSLGVFGCAKDSSKIIDEKVRERVEGFRKKKKEECRLNILAKAEKQVDSLLLAEAQQSLQDSLSKLKPFRPDQPPLVPPIDSLKVEPLFKNPPKQ